MRSLFKIKSTEEHLGIGCLCGGVSAWRDINHAEGPSSQHGTFFSTRDIQPCDGRPSKGHQSFAWGTCPWHGTFFSMRDLHLSEGHSSCRGTCNLKLDVLARDTSLLLGTPVLGMGHSFQ
ncbi:hypothetical protein C0J52_08424 [Blattella germanica]|nr:hypothetical protein C0J52_08424 [Blattella germanica]